MTQQQPPRGKKRTETNPNGAGRTIKATKETFNALFTALRTGNNRKDSCVLASISDETLARWIKGGLPPDSEISHMDFLDQLGKAEVFAKHESIRIMREAAPKDWKAAAWWLSRRHRDEYAERFEQTGADGMPLGVVQFPVNKDVPGA